MKQKIGLTVVLLVLIALIGSAGYLLANQNSTGIKVETNGTKVTIQSSSWWEVPSAMLDEMKVKALEDVEDPDSNVESIKTDMQNIASKYNYTVQVKIVSQFGEDQLPMPATVKGTSMVPTLADGQSIVVLKTSDFKVGDIVVAHHPEYNLIVKRVGQINGSEVYLESDNKNIEVESQTRYVNGVKQVVTITKTPLNTWVPKSYVIGVVEEY
ncbi:MAG: LexA repressor [Methanobacterium sp. PtaB.Bin024]|nr:MAG: LexA repressor [Methanobacterium sp. PtaB.Bin024]